MKKGVRILVSLLMVSTRASKPKSIIGTDSSGTGAMARLAATLCATLLLVSVGPSAAGTPTGATHFITNLLDTSVRNFTGSDLSEHERMEQFNKLLHENFATKSIARFIMGHYWRQATEEQKEEFIDLITQMIIRRWHKDFSELLSNDFDVTSEKVVSGRINETVIVGTSHNRTSAHSLSIQWFVAKKDQIYKIVDVKVADISMAISYRNEISSVLHNNGGSVEDLLQAMRLLLNPS